jgi:hypothetical protein
MVEEEEEEEFPTILRMVELEVVQMGVFNLYRMVA